MNISNLVSLFPVTVNSIMAHVFLFLYLLIFFFLSLTGRSKIALFIFMKKNVFKKDIFNHYIF